LVELYYQFWNFVGNKYNRKIYYIEEFGLLAVEAVYVP
jgi:hypothetical protein